jgi:hypothetical protein
MGVAGRTRRAGLLTALAGLGLAGLTVAAAAASAAAASPRPASPPSAAGPAAPGRAAGTVSSGFIAPPRVAPSGSELRQVCPTPAHPGQMTCMAVLPARSARSAGAAGLAPAAGPPSGAYGPPALQQAYRLRSTAMTAPAGGTDTVAVVDAYNDPHAAGDLAVYRREYGLPFCTASSGCVKVVSQSGRKSLPAADPTGAWALEESLDLDMVSATCPYCHILLVEAKSDSIANLAIAERYAAAHANAVSNSWGSGAEFVGENRFDSAFFRPGVAITASAGDNGYGTQFPAASPYVTAVGGTTLQGATASNSGRQTVWQGTGSGCSVLEPQPSWQESEPGFPAACRNRTETDIAAVADPDPGVAVYDSVKYSSAAPDWTSVGGTSVSAPIIAAAYALADISTGQPGTGLAPGTMPAAYPYASRLSFTDVTAGSNGTCPASRAYLCHGEVGYDGPTGLGTPHGLAGLRAPGNLMSVLDPGTQVYRTGAAVRLQFRAQGEGTGTASYSAAGLPAGLKLSGTGIAGSLTGQPGIYPVRVTATRGHATGTAAFDIVVVARMTVSHPAAGRVRLGLRGICLGTAGGHTASGTKVRIGNCTGRAALRWTFRPGSSPAGSGQLRVRGHCLTIWSGTGNGAAATLRSCSASAAGQHWQYRAGDELYNPHSDRCLAGPGGSRTAGRPVALWACSGAAAQSWQLPAAPVLAGIRGRCLAAKTGSQVQIAACAVGPAQKWVMKRTGALTIRGRCLSVAGGSTAAGAAVQLAACGRSAAQRWDPGPHGQLVNENSGLCLSDPKDARASGTALVQSDCYGRPGQIWAVS